MDSFYLFIFYPLIAVAKTSKTMLIVMVKNTLVPNYENTLVPKYRNTVGHPCLVPDFRGNAFNVSPLRIMFAVGLSYIAFIMLRFSSVQFSCSVVCDSLQSHELQHARPPCPPPTPGVHPNSCLLSWWCQPTISSSVILFSCSQSFPASRYFPMSQLFASSGQSIAALASVSVLPMNMQDWFSLGDAGQSCCKSRSLPTNYVISVPLHTHNQVVFLLFCPASHLKNTR